MSRIKRLINSYSKFIAVPWRDDAAAAQRVIFCVYNENEELRLRAGIDEFEIATRQADHDWAAFDLTDSFAGWLSVVQCDDLAVPHGDALLPGIVRVSRPYPGIDDSNIPAF